MILKIRTHDGWFYLDDIERLSTVIARSEIAPPDQTDVRRWFSTSAEVTRWIEDTFATSASGQFDAQWWHVDLPSEGEGPRQSVTALTFTRRGRWELCVVGSGSEAYLLNDAGRTIDRV